MNPAPVCRWMILVPAGRGRKPGKVKLTKTTHWNTYCVIAARSAETALASAKRQTLCGQQARATKESPETLAYWADKLSTKS